MSSINFNNSNTIYHEEMQASPLEQENDIARLATQTLSAASSQNTSSLNGRATQVEASALTLDLVSPRITGAMLMSFPSQQDPLLLSVNLFEDLVSPQTNRSNRQRLLMPAFLPEEENVTEQLGIQIVVVLNMW